MSNDTRTPTTNRLLFALIGILTAAIVLVAVYIVIRQVTAPAESVPVTFERVNDDFAGDTPIDPPRDMPDFTLTDQHDAAVSLSDFSGKPVLMAYGFTHCPDVCPITLGEFKSVHEALGESASEVAFVFISVDGKRDTPARLRRYLQLRQVDDFVVGLTGSEDEIRRVSADYGVKFSYSEPDENGAYNVDHTAGYYLLDAAGNWIMRYDFGTDPALMASQIREIIAPSA